MTTTQQTPTRSRHTWHLVRHYLEMVVAMLVGMMVLGPGGGLAWPGRADRFDVHALVMATNMAVAMAAWMRFRCHSWPAITEMSAAMYLPFAVLLVPYWAGALGYLLKDVSADRLVEAVQAAARGESVLQPSVAAKVVARFAQLDDAPRARPQPLVVPLSDRELDVLRLLADGRSNREIATALFLAEGTVKNHVTNVLAKLGARDRTQAALRARALDLL